MKDSRHELCVDCKKEKGTETVYLFDSEHEGDKALMCKACWISHEDKADWCS